ncbi:hypothetical protein [Candidatus Entotheonella palauensis]|uniref:hypothetical protein n=1 Tax=Candidatus Entotheonella palauensis TaxID=93172 RepID=UPI0015C41A51|nr:hypothetical protein [Candidatus Entotheonella palauensis]
MTAYLAIGATLSRPTALVILAWAYGKAGQPEAGLRLLAEGRALVDIHGGALV